VTPDVPAGKNPVKYFMKNAPGGCVYRLLQLTRNNPRHRRYASRITDEPGHLGAQNKSTHDAAYRFAMYLMSPQAQAILPRYGFNAVAMTSPQ
jgi:hypothetical protein